MESTRLSALGTPLLRFWNWHPSRAYSVTLADCFVYAGILAVLARAGFAWAGVKYGSFFILVERNFEVVYTATVPNPTWLTARLGDFQSAHIWSWTLIGALGAWLAWRHRNPVATFLTVGFVIGLHEMVWYGVYFLKHPIPYEIGRNLSQYYPWMLFAAMWVPLFLYARRHPALRLPIQMNPLWLAWGIWMLVLWPWAFDFRLSLDLKIGVTPDYLSDFVNGLEFTSWSLITGAMAWSGAWKRRLFGSTEQKAP